MHLCFGNGKLVLVGFTDVDIAGDMDSRKSTSGYLITFVRGAISWQSKLQKCVALSTTKAEYIVTIGALQKSFVDKEVPIGVGPRARKIFHIQ